jgi:transposase
MSDTAKLGPALGIAVLRSGLSFELISEDIGYSKQTVYTWIFGRAYPHHSTHKRLRELTDLLEKATAKGGSLPVLDAVTLLQERELLKQARARYNTAAIS